MIEFYIMVTALAAIGSFIGSSQCIRSIREQNENPRSNNRRVTFKNE